MNLKHLFAGMAACAAIALSAGCGGDSSTSPDTTPADPAVQAQAEAAVFQRATDRAKLLLEQKDFGGARATLSTLDSYKLSPEQQKVVDDIKAKIPQGN